MRLAYMAMSWQSSCDMNQIKDKGIRNTFFKTAMNSFSSGSVPLATAFSVYVHAAEKSEVESPCLAVTGVFFEKYNLPMTRQSEFDHKEVHPGFYEMISAGEGFRAWFENKFDDFVFAAMAKKTKDEN